MSLESWLTGPLIRKFNSDYFATKSKTHEIIKESIREYSNKKLASTLVKWHVQMHVEKVQKKKRNGQNKAYQLYI